MGDLFEVVANQFQSNTQYDKFIKQSEKEYDVKNYRLSSFAQMHAKQIYLELQAKYQDNTLSEFPHGWYQNERRLYVWFIICFIHFKAIDPVKFIDGYEKYWRNISEAFWRKEIYFLKYQLLNIFKIKGRTIWKAEEDQLLKDVYKLHDLGEWNEVAKTFYQRSNGRYFKTPKQCRERWQNHLNNEIKKGDWSNEQDLLIFRQVQKMGTKWAKIAIALKKTRTEHMIKNRYKSLISKIVNQRNVDENQAAVIMLKELELRNDLFKKERNTRGSLNDDLGIEEVESQEIQDSQILENQEEVSKKSKPIKSNKIIRKEERQSLKSNGWRQKKSFDINKSIKEQNEINIGEMHQYSSRGVSSFFGRNLLEDSTINIAQLMKLDQCNQSSIFSNGFHRYQDKGSIIVSSSHDFKKDYQGSNSNIFFENESGRSKKSNKNKSIIGQYLCDN